MSKGKNYNTELDKIMKKHNLKLIELSRFWGIPYRTIQDWKYGKRRTPKWIIKAIDIYLFLKEKNYLDLFQNKKNG